MSELVRMLREDAEEIAGCGAGNEAGRMRIAADRIEQLEAVVRELADTKPGGEIWERSRRLNELADRARAALSSAGRG